jgi:hypothetical protein
MTEFVFNILSVSSCVYIQNLSSTFLRLLEPFAEIICIQQNPLFLCSRIRRDNVF